jgi:hypothetical protein
VAALAAVAAVIAAFVALGGGEEGPEKGASAASVAKSTSQKPLTAKANTEPTPLTGSELIAKADAICEDSQRRYLAVRDLESEYSTDVPYAESLVRTARVRVRELRELKPPPGLAAPYREYVEAQERVYATDKQALAAARKGDAVGVEAARDRRDAEDALREGLAEEIGFNVCSTQN